MGSPRVFALPPREDWICDRFVNEWRRWSALSIDDLESADVVWLLADWCWRRVPMRALESKRVVTTVHHLVPEKMGPNEREDFRERDQITHAYHVPCETTRLQIEHLTRKPIHVMPFWVNERLWQPAGPELSRTALRRGLGLPEEGFLVGSFQRDTEGRDLVSPKLEKGPDLLCDALATMHPTIPGLHVVLAGWRRQYVMGRLQASGIPFTFFERPTLPRLRYLYLALDLYMVTARYEGGPQAVVECASMGVPIVSTPVGLAPAVLAARSVGLDVTSLTPDPEHARAAVERLLVSDGMTDHVRAFERMFEQVALS